MKKLSLMLACLGLFSAGSFASGYFPSSKVPQDGNKKQTTEKVALAPAVKKETTASAPKKRKPLKKVNAAKSIPATTTIEQKKK